LKDIEEKNVPLGISRKKKNKFSFSLLNINLWTNSELPKKGRKKRAKESFHGYTGIELVVHDN
jgi:hypothetical protein